MVDISKLRDRLSVFFGDLPDIMFDNIILEEEGRLIVPIKIFLFSKLDESYVEWQIEIGKTIAQKYGLCFESLSTHSGGIREMCFVFPVDGLDDAMARAGMIAGILAQFQIALNWTRRWIKRGEKRYVYRKRVEVGLDAVGLSFPAL